MEVGGRVRAADDGDAPSQPPTVGMMGQGSSQRSSHREPWHKPQGPLRPRGVCLSRERARRGRFPLPPPPPHSPLNWGWRPPPPSAPHPVTHPASGPRWQTRLVQRAASAAGRPPTVGSRDGRPAAGAASRRCPPPPDASSHQKIRQPPPPARPRVARQPRLPQCPGQRGGGGRRGDRAASRGGCACSEPGAARPADASPGEEEGRALPHAPQLGGRASLPACTHPPPDARQPAGGAAPHATPPKKAVQRGRPVKRRAARVQVEGGRRIVWQGGGSLDHPSPPQTRGGAAGMTARPALCRRHRGKGSTCLGVGKAVLGGGGRRGSPTATRVAGWLAGGHSDGRGDGRPDAANHTAVPVGWFCWRCYLLRGRADSPGERCVRATPLWSRLEQCAGYAAARRPLQASHRRGSVQKLDDGHTPRGRATVGLVGQQQPN